MAKSNVIGPASVVVFEDVITKEQACELLNIKIRTLDELLRTGKLKAHKKNARWLILRSDLIEYIKS